MPGDFMDSGIRREDGSGPESKRLIREVKSQM